MSSAVKPPTTQVAKGPGFDSPVSAFHFTYLITSDVPSEISRKSHVFRAVTVFSYYGYATYWTS